MVADAIEVAWPALCVAFVPKAVGGSKPLLEMVGAAVSDQFAPEETGVEP